MIQIQCFWRRKLAENIAHKRQISAVKIQSAIRDHLARKLAEKRKASAVIRIQCSWRRCLMYYIRDHLKIQCVIREHLAANQLATNTEQVKRMESMETRHFATNVEKREVLPLFFERAKGLLVVASIVGQVPKRSF